VGKSIAMHFAVVQMPTMQLPDVHVRGAMETKMTAGWEYDELASQ
jgi:hypothetical protein